jgi:thiol-disulfide isomerase/thioredoxin
VIAPATIASFALMAALVVARPQIGDPAPHLDLVTLDGKRIGRERLEGRVTVVEFFATWCLPCRRSLDDLHAIRGQLGRGVDIVIVAVESEAPALREYFVRIPPPEGAIVVHDTTGEVARRWGKDRLPTSFFVDRGAVIRHINRGHGPGFRARATRWLQRLLAADRIPVAP